MQRAQLKTFKGIEMLNTEISLFIQNKGNTSIKKETNT